MKIKYIEKRFSSHSKALISAANSIIAEYQKQGYELTLRQLFYQFVARDLIPNTTKEYKNLGRIINDGRLAGLISWAAIVDRTRNLETNSHWKTPADIVETCSRSFQIDKWLDQKNRVEVWIEKDALLGVIERVCRPLDIPYFSCRGYTSQSELWAAGQRLKRYKDVGQTPVIIHLGDHDPSGKDMTRDIEDRLAMFMGGCEVNRIALNMNQIKKYNPPPNPAKLTDSRSTGYIKEFGSQSWELDALDPKVLHALIEKTVLKYRDERAWKNSKQEEDGHRERLAEMAEELRNEE
jgi:hypothetical protein